MSISKHISWTRIVPPLIMVLSALCFLPFAKKSEQYSLTSKAYQATYQETYTFRTYDSMWQYDSNYYIYRDVYLQGDGVSTYTGFAVSYAGEYANQREIEWNVEIYDSAGNTRLYTSASKWFAPSYVLNCGLRSVAPSEYSQNTDIVYRARIWVHRVDNGAISASDMFAGGFTWYFYRSVDVPENTLPAEWLETTTYSIENPLSTVTTVIPPDYDITTQDIDPFLAIPEKITAAMQGCIFWLGRLLNLKYVTFLLCFVLIVGLVAWLIH